MASDLNSNDKNDGTLTHHTYRSGAVTPCFNIK